MRGLRGWCAATAVMTMAAGGCGGPAGLIARVGGPIVGRDQEIYSGSGFVSTGGGEIDIWSQVVALPATGGPKRDLITWAGNIGGVGVNSNSVCFTATAMVAADGTMRTSVFTVPRVGGASTELAGTNARVVTPESVACDDSAVFWAEVADKSVRLRSVPVAGGAARDLATLPEGFTIRGIAVDESFVYYTAPSVKGQPGSVTRISRADGSATVLAAEEPNPVAIAVDGGVVYWADRVGGEEGSIVRYDLASGTRLMIAGGLEQPSALAVADGAVYVTTSSLNELGDRPPDSVLRVPTSGGTVVTLASDLMDPESILVLGPKVYVTDWEGLRAFTR